MQAAETAVTRPGTDIPQFPPFPVLFDQSATEDNLVVLMAAASEHDVALDVFRSNPGSYPKHFWIKDWSRRMDALKWSVALHTGAVYHVYAKVAAHDRIPLTLAVAGTAGKLDFTTANTGWDSVDAGLIDLPSGTNQLVLRRNTDATNGLAIISLELIRESDRPAYEQRVKAFRGDSTWFSRSRYGLMFQFGPWGYPPKGDHQSPEAFAGGFDVPRFVNLVTNTGARYVVWSMTWWTYQMCAPIRSVDRIMGNQSGTTRRDLVGELAAALHRAGVRFLLYYHTGQDSHLAYNTTAWWRAQHFPEPAFSERGGGDRGIFFTNWINVIAEIGNRYGTNLDGWFFDDGTVYYPAPFERLGRAAKAGNPARLLGYNQPVRYTDFQELCFGENAHGEEQTGSSPAGGSGIFSAGPFTGLLQHGMFRMEQDWGVHAAGQLIEPRLTTAQAVGWVRSASERGVPLSFNLMMWENQSCSPSSLAVLAGLNRVIYGGEVWTNLVGNGDFESPHLAYFSRFGSGSEAIPGWRVDPAPPDGVQLAAPQVLGNNGTQTLQLSGGSGYTRGGAISQTISTRPGRMYEIRIDVASRQNNLVRGDFNFGGSHHALAADSETFTTLTWTAVANSGTTFIKITGAADSKRGQLLIDNVVVSPSAGH